LVAAQLFSARPSRPNQEGPRADSWTREAERCTGVTNAVFGKADGAAVLAERAPPLRGGGGRGNVFTSWAKRWDWWTAGRLFGMSSLIKAALFKLNSGCIRDKGRLTRANALRER
jgi:hypothetical protein